MIRSPFLVIFASLLVCVPCVLYCRALLIVCCVLSRLADKMILLEIKNRIIEDTLLHRFTR